MERGTRQKALGKLMDGMLFALVIALWWLIVYGLLAPAQAHSQSPWTNTKFRPMVLTGSGQTVLLGGTGQLGGNNHGNSFGVCTLQVTGVSLTTATFAIEVSADGTNWASLLITPTTGTTGATTQTVTSSPSMFTVPCGGWNYLEAVSSGTFTATSVSIVLTASPNAQAGLGGGGGGGGGCGDALTLAASGGAAPGVTFNCGASVTADYHTVGAAPAAVPAASVVAGALNNGMTATTQTTGDITTKVATDAFVIANAGSGGVPAIKSFSQLFCVGDSYMYGSSAASRTVNSICPLVAASMPGIYTFNYTNDGVSSQSAADSVNTLFNNFASFPLQPSFGLVLGGNNDGTSCGTSSNCLKSFQGIWQAGIAFISLPIANRTMATLSSGTTQLWTQVNGGDGGPTINTQPQSISSFGYPAYTTVSGATKTFTTGASTVVGVTYQVAGSRGTFTISIDGTLQTDLCSGTTTFTDQACGNVGMSGQSVVPFEQFFSGLANTTHTVVITTTNSNEVSIQSVDWVPANCTSTLCGGVVAIGPNAYFTGSSNYDSQWSTMVTAMNGYGIPVFYASEINGTPGVNSTTDISTSSTTTCNASNATGHPNSTCGYFKMAQTVYNAAVAGNYYFANPPAPPLTPASGSGSVTAFSSGNLSPLFTTSVATSTTTPSQTFALSNAAQNSVFAGPASGGAGAPSYQTAPTFSAANLTSIPACATCVVASSPGAGVAHFAGSTQTVTSSAIVGSDMTNATVTATQLAAQYSKGSCTEVWVGSGTSSALTSGDDAVSNNTCYNDSGVTRTITAVKCRSDNGSNTTTTNPTFGSAGTGTTILSGAVTCGSSYAYSSSGTVSNASWTTGAGIDPAMSGTLTGTSIAMIVEYTF